jgi:hypothetical protein
MTPLAFLATDEQILDIALRSISTKDYNIDGIDGQIIVAYAMKEDPDMSAEDLANGVAKLITDHILSTLVDIDKIRPDFSKTGYYTRASND